jgi:predicted DNA binding CopG/RHH family protein
MPRRKRDARLDSEERRILDEYERGEWVPVPEPERTRVVERLRVAATNTLAAMEKDRRINIRLSAATLASLKARAAEEGLPYQTLVGSVLHKYATGRLVERRVPIAAPARPVRRKR